MAASSKKRFRAKTVSHTELRNRITSMYREKVPLTIWQEATIRGALISNLTVGSYQMVLKSNDKQELNFNPEKTVHLFGRGMLAHTMISSVCNKNKTVKLELPKPKAVRLTENRATSRVDAVDLNVPLTLTTTEEEDEEERVKFNMILVNLSCLGLAARMTHGRDASFIHSENLNLVGFGRSTFKKPIILNIGHVTNNVHVKNFGPENTVMGLKFADGLKKAEFIHLLEEISN